MFAHEGNHLLTHVITVDRVYVKAAEKSFSRRHSCFFMSTRTQSAVNKLVRRRLAKIVRQQGKHYPPLPRLRNIVEQLAPPPDHEHCVGTEICLRLPLPRLR